MSVGFDPLLREVNLRIHALTREFREPAEYLCECGSPTCQGTMITLQPCVFTDLLAVQSAVLVLPGHETVGMKTVSQGRGYLFVS
jgi:hypothetical protein